MARTVHLLTSPALTSLGPGLHHDGRGLYLQVKNGGRSWVFRYMRSGKARAMGLGPYPGVTLAKARRNAEAARSALHDGIDPLEERKAKLQAEKLAAAKGITFKDSAERYIDAHRSEWRNAKHAAQWKATLTRYAFPILGGLPVQAVNTSLITKVLEAEGLWEAKRETANRLRQRVEAVLDWATARGYRTGDNPARWRGHLENLLSKPNKTREVKHFEAMPYADLPTFFEELSKRDTVSARALAFTILTAARSGETRNATLNEIDFKGAVWTVPEGRTKSGRTHRVPLTKEALAILRRHPTLHVQADPATVLFPNSRGQPLSDTAIRKYLQEDLGKTGMTVHGFRSTFRVWAAEQTNFPGEIAEAALAHVTGDKTEEAYQRSDYLTRRRKLMEAWAKFCSSGALAAEKVVPLRRKAATR